MKSGTRSLTLALALLLFESAASAHTLDVTTARISLRDEHIEVILELDPFLLMNAGPTEVATTSEADLLLRLTAAQQILTVQSKLVVDGVPIPLTLRGFPTPPEFRAMAATLSAAQKEHGELVRLRMEAAPAVPGAKSVALSLPKVVGPAVVSFVQPSTRYLPPGETSAFSVLQAPRPLRPGVLWQWLAGVLAVTALALTWLIGQRKQREDRT